MKKLSINLASKQTATLTLAALVTLLSLPASAESHKTMQKTYDLDSNGRVSLSNVNGDVKVEACDCDQVKMTADIYASNETTLEKVSIKVKESTSHLNIETHHADEKHIFRNGDSWRVEYRLSVPRNARLDKFELVNGDLTVSGVKGELIAELVNGEVSADNLTAPVNLETVNGTIDVSFADLSEVSHITLESVNGAIRLGMPSDADMEVDASTVSGSISTDFDLRVDRDKVVGSDLHDRIGAGKTHVKLENVNGAIRLNHN